MELCYEYFRYEKTDCIVYGAPDPTECWEIEGTLGSSLGVEQVREKVGNKEDACKKCIYYVAVNQH